MSDLQVQIERLAPMRVAALTVHETSPETTAINAVLDWARERDLLARDFRLFGFDNCQPDPDHTYTVWLDVESDVKADGDIRVEEFPGGLYATTEVIGVANISPSWQRLLAWCKEHGHPPLDAVGLEEHLEALSNPLPEFLRVRLYLPIGA